MAEKSVIATISQAEERPFKIPQLPALRVVVMEPAPQKRRFFLLLYFPSPRKHPGRKTGSLCAGGSAVQNRPEASGREQGLCPSPKEGTQPLTQPNRGCFPSLCPSARRLPKVGPGFRPDRRSSAAPSPTTSDRRSACLTNSMVRRARLKK